MTKNIKKLEKDNMLLRKKSEQTDVTLIDMAEEVFFFFFF
jgi:DNA-binding MarR family transcriptional regulator